MAAFPAGTLDEQEISAVTAADGSAAASSTQRHTKASRKRPLANAEDLDRADAAVAEPAASGSVGTSRRLNVPSRPSCTSTSVRPHGKAVAPEVRCQPAQMHEADFMLR